MFRYLLIILIALFSMIFFAPEIAAKEANVTVTIEIKSFLWIVSIVGGCIATTLAYVSYKKYKSMKKKQTNDKSNS